MTVERLWVAALGLSMLFGISTMWTKHAATQQPRVVVAAAPVTTSVSDSAPRALPAREDDWAEPRVDLNGNEIDEAVSDYRVDGRGEMYERHAPDTALLHLSSPKL